MAQSSQSLKYFNATNQQSLRDEVTWLRALLQSQARRLKAQQKLKLEELLRIQEKRLAEIEAASGQEGEGTVESCLDRQTIKAELDCYQAAGLTGNHKDSYQLNLDNVFLPFPRSIYLAIRAREISIAKSYIEHDKSDEKKEETKPLTLGRRIANKFINAYEVLKKIIDLMDDLWGSIATKLLPEQTVKLVSPYLVSLTGGIVHATEWVKAIFALKKAILKTKTAIRKTKIVSNTTTIALTSVGMGLSIAYFASGTGLAVAGASLIPVLVPAMMMGVLGVSLWRHAYQLHDVNAQIERQKQKQRDLIANIKSFEKNNKIEVEKRTTLLARAANASVQELESIAKAIKVSYKRQNDNDVALAAAQAELAAQPKLFATLDIKQKKAEREVAMNTIEVVAAALVFIGALLGAAAIVGAGSVATFGMLPLALIITGVVIGVLVKSFELIDKHFKNYAYSNAIIGKLKKGWNKVCSLFKKQPEAGIELDNLSLQAEGMSPAGIYNGLGTKPVVATEPAPVPAAKTTNNWRAPKDEPRFNIKLNDMASLRPAPHRG